jgi:hypothetical protein
MKKIINYKFLIFAIGVLFSFTSCLKSGLDELPAFEDTEIANIFFEHRFLDPNDKWTDGSSIVQFQRLEVTKEIKTNESAAEDSVIVTLSVPKPSGSFTTEERQKVTLENMVCYMNISTAAKIEPLDGAPVLGKPGDFTSPRKYKITAADGKTTRIWVIKVNPLPEINQYEGLYHETGTLLRAGNPPDVLDAEIYITTVNSNTCRAQAGKSVFDNPGILYQIQVNADNSVTIKSDPNAVVVIYQQASKPSSYDPATKTFDLHYAYRNDERLFDTKMVLK